MRIEIAKLHQELQATIIYVTHDQIEAMTLADKICVLSPLRDDAESNLEQYGAPLELYHNPRNKFVAGFIGSPKMNFLDCVLVEVGEKQCKVKLFSSESVLSTSFLSIIRTQWAASRARSWLPSTLELSPSYT